MTGLSLVQRLEYAGVYEDALRIAAAHQVTLGEILGRSRRASIARARAELVGLLRDRGWICSRIGRLLGRDHSTVMNMVVSK